MEKEFLYFDPPRVYARGCRVGDFIFLAGEDGKDYHTQEVVEGGIVPQTELTFDNIRRTLADFGATFDDIIKTTVYLVNQDDRRPFQEVRKRYLSHPVPSSTIIVKELAPKVLVEVEVIAYGPSKQP